MPNLYDSLVSGWVSCGTGREELVAINEAQLLDLTSGGLPCPACATSCKPSFRTVALSADMAVVKWKDGKWMRAFVLGK